MHRLTPEEKYQYSLRKQKKTLDEFAAHEIEWAEYLLYWYKLRKEEIPDDEYRAAAFFINKEYERKPGSLTLVYEMFLKVHKELPPATKETAFDLLSYRFCLYARVLVKGGFD
jgi:hypothetical protein